MSETPEDRVLLFAEELERWEGPDAHIATTGEYNTPVRHKLDLSDLRDVLDELHEHQEILIAIDKVLSQFAGAHLKVDRIRKIMGNHQNEETD
jgi:hypothetical protein